MTRNARGPALAGLLILFCISAARAQGEAPAPFSLSVAAPEIALDVPMPVNSGNLTLLLAQAGQGTSLSSLKDEALRKYHRHLHSELAAQLLEFFTDEEVPLVTQGAALTLHNTLNVTVIKHLSELQSKRGYDLERGTVELTGDFHYRLQNASGTSVREQKVDIAGLGVREKYLVKTPQADGEAEDDTEETIKRALSAMVEELLERIEDDLEADELRALARL